MGKRNVRGCRKTRKQLSKLNEMERKMEAQMAEVATAGTIPTIPPASPVTATGSSSTSSLFKLDCFQSGRVTIQKSSDGGVKISESPSFDTTSGTVGKHVEKSINSIANATISLKKELEITVEMKVGGGRTTQHSSINKNGKKHVEDILHGVGELIEGSVTQLRKGSVVMQKLSKQEESVTQTTNENGVWEKVGKQEVSVDELINGMVFAKIPAQEILATECTAANMAPESSPKKEATLKHEKREDIEASPYPVPSEPASLQDQASNGSSCSVNQVTVREVVDVACRRCRLSQCSNCLSAFKNGDKIIMEIPTMKKTKTGASAALRIETALIRIFKATSPYSKWVRRKEKIHLSLKSMDDRHVKVFEENEDFISRAFEVIDRFLTSSCTHWKIEDISGRAQELVKNIKTAEGTDETVLKGILQVLTLNRLDELDDQLKNASLGATEKREDYESDWESKGDLVLFEPAQGFQLCAGCGQLLTVLHNAWEGWKLKMYSDEEYFNVVMVGFDRAAEAQRVIFEPKADSNMKVIKDFSDCRHPKQCNVRYNSSGEKVPLGKLKSDAMKKAVGSLHSYMGESWQRILKEFRTVDIEPEDSRSPDWVTSDEELNSSETESDGAVKPN